MSVQHVAEWWKELGARAWRRYDAHVDRMSAQEARQALKREARLRAAFQLAAGLGLPAPDPEVTVGVDEEPGPTGPLGSGWGAPGFDVGATLNEDAPPRGVVILEPRREPTAHDSAHGGRDAR